jgi:hypothetical protein
MPSSDERAPVRSILILVIGIKLLILLFGIQMFRIELDRLPDPPGGLHVWNRWDTEHYLEIATHGYRPEGTDGRRIVFYPLYPWLVRGASVAIDDPFYAALGVSAIASIVAALLLWWLARLDMGRTAAWHAVVFCFIFPTSYFLHIGYTESLFLALALGAFLCARKRIWWAAGVLSALAALTRLNGLLLIPALALEAFEQYRTERRFDARSLWILFGGAGFAVYLGLNEMVLGDPFAFMTMQKVHWHKSLSLPWTGIEATWRSLTGGSPAEAQMVGFYELAFVVLGLVVVVWSWAQLRRSYAIWITLNWLLFTSTSFILSVPRYSLAMFPMFILFADLAEKSRLWNALITVCSLILLALFASRFAQGAWAF